MNVMAMSNKDREHVNPQGPKPGKDREELTETLKRSSFPGATPKRIGHYHIKRVIAMGGMGTVYEATQEKPRRTVALKLMKQGIASRSALRRFEYESQILARLRHPGIAQIYEAGTHRDDNGTVPYFAMEYIPNALPINKYVREKKLGTRQKLELFASVCDAVHHGHQKGIIHRDLKPGNILVDSHGKVKVIDFGVARGTDSDLAVTTVQTDIGQLIGTLQYMSPEQCLADPHDIDTRSDVYALGVVLYELLSGKLPYKVSSTRIFDGTRIIREQEPTKLSTIDKSLKNDVETIILKALEKDRERRYQSSLELAQDIRRYLTGEAIIARPPSIVYQLRIFARKNKALFGATAAVFVVLVGGVIVSTSLYLQAQTARVEAEWQAERAQAAILKTLAARTEAERQTEKAQAAVDFLQNWLWNADPSRVGREVKLVTMLDRVGPAVRYFFQGQPETEAMVRTTIGLTYRGLLLYEPAEEHLTFALDILKRNLGEEHPDTLTSMYNLADVRQEQGRLGEAESLTVQVLEIRRRILGEDHPDTLDSLDVLAWFRQDEGKLAEAERLKRHVLEARKRILGEKDSGTQRAIGSLANLLLVQNRVAEAKRLYREKSMPNSLGIEKWFQGGFEASDRVSTILVFWETWCPYCEREVPRLQKLYAKYKDRGLQVIGLTELTYNSTEEKVRDYIKDKRLTYPIAKGNGEAKAYFDIDAVPTAVAVKDGLVVWRGHPKYVSEEMIGGLVGDSNE